LIFQVVFLNEKEICAFVHMKVQTDVIVEESLGLAWGLLSFFLLFALLGLMSFRFLLSKRLLLVSLMENFLKNYKIKNTSLDSNWYEKN
jgi:hypothetical protein